MATLKVFHYPRCSTCVKALRHLDAKGLSYTAIDISKKAPSRSELKKMLSSYEGNIRKLFNTSGKLYRELDMKTKIAKSSEKELLSLLAEEGMLVKRPFVLGEDVSLVGFREAEWKEQGL